MISTLPQIGDRITDKSASPDERTVREWIGADGFEYWAKLRTWIDESYPEVFAPDWLYGGKEPRLVATLQEDQGVLPPGAGIPTSFSGGGHG